MPPQGRRIAVAVADRRAYEVSEAHLLAALGNQI
jgi:hypothetical protein